MNAENWFRRGCYGLLLLAVLHFFSNRHGLPIAVDDPAGRELLRLLADYRIDFFGLERTLDQTLAGFIASWGLMLALIAGLNLAWLARGPERPVLAASLNLLCWSLCLVAALLWWSWPQMLLFAIISGCFALSLHAMREPIGGGAGGNRSPARQPRVAVIGAGPAGLTAAWTLKQRGYETVTVFEKAAEPGGKCVTFQDGDFAIDFVAHEMLAGYTDVMRIAKAVDAPSNGFQKVLVYDRPQAKFLGMLAASSLGGYSKMQVGWASLKYTWLLLTRYRGFARPGTGLDGAPPELLQSTETWLRAHGLEALTLTAQYVMTVQGYGRLDQVPAAYFVKFQGLRNWVSNVLHILGLIQYWPRVFTAGFQDLWKRVAAQLDVRYDSQIRAIRRELAPGSNEIRISLELADGQTLEFDELILSCPLDLPTLTGLGLDLDAAERDLFSQVEYYQFVTTACRVRGLPWGVVGSIPLPAPTHYTGYIKVYPDCDIAVFFSLVPDPDANLDEVYDNIVAAVGQLPQTGSEAPAVVERVRQKNWPYFPHPAAEALAAGYFSRLASQQGRRRTYYAASLLEMETVGNTVAFTQNLIQTQFRTLR